MPEPLTVLIVGAGNGGKACAADVCAHSSHLVRLFEFKEFASSNLSDKLVSTKTLRANWPLTSNVDKRQAQSLSLDKVYRPAADDEEAEVNMLREAMTGAQVIILSTVSQAHTHAAAMLYKAGITSDQMLLLNPGSTGGSLIMAKEFRRAGSPGLPLLVEFSTLLYGCRAQEEEVNVSVLLEQGVSYGVFPGGADAARSNHVHETLQSLFPGRELQRAPSVLAAGLSNANPVIHPAITLSNLARFEQHPASASDTGDNKLTKFYAQGVSPMVAKLIEASDNERLALMKALGYEEQALPDTVTSEKQGYCICAETYFDCYGKGPGFSHFDGPWGGPLLAKHRYFSEDVGCGLVFFCELGKVLNVPTPVSHALTVTASCVTGVDWLSAKRKTLEHLGMGGCRNAKEMNAFMQTGGK